MPTASIARSARRGFLSPKRDAIAAIKGRGDRPIRPGDMIVLICRGPMGSGMEEVLSDHVGAEAFELGQARWPCSPTLGSPA